MKNACIVCKVRPIVIKSRGLCKLCAGRYYRERSTTPTTEELSFYREHKIQFSSEVEFIRNFFAHSDWVYQPVHFRLDSCGYQPDFYDGKRNVFIEVSGTHQAFYANREKYRLFMRTFPKIKLEIRLRNGDLIPFSETEGTFPENK